MIAIMRGTIIEGLSKLTAGERRLAAGEKLFRIDDPVVSLFLVVSGEMQLVRTLPHGAQVTLQRASPGTILAEASLFAERYHCDAVALEDSVLAIVPLRRVKAALRDDPDLAAGFIRHLAHEIQRARTQAEMLLLKTVAERVDAWIALNGGSFAPKGRWRQVASEIGVTPEALYRELARRR
jgi:CRP-like cAMP-binding protein